MFWLYTHSIFDLYYYEEYGSHLSPGAVLPALQQTVPVTCLARLRFDQVCAGSGLRALAQPLALTVAHAQHVQRTVTRTAFTGAVAPARHVPPEEDTESVTCHCPAQLLRAKGYIFSWETKDICDPLCKNQANVYESDYKQSFH